MAHNQLCNLVSQVVVPLACFGGTSRERVLMPRKTLTVMLIVLFATLLFGGTASAQQYPCYGYAHCYGLPASSGSQPQSTLWSGFTDGRVNPVVDEYYSIWCKNSFVEIWRGVPGGSMLQMFSIQHLVDLDSNGGTLTIPNGFLLPFTVTRADDLITISGNFGNLQPQPGAKSFNLSECLARNGALQPPTGTNYPTSRVGTFCYGRDSEPVRQGRVPRDQICPELDSVGAVIPR
jgi:hypothetical protein